MSNEDEEGCYDYLLTMTDDELKSEFNNHNHVSVEDLRSSIVPKIVENDGEFDFNGKNCDDDNCFWNGIDRRCNCGNRRVSWCSDHGYWYGEAY